MGLRHLRQRQVCVGCDPTAAELGRRPPRNANTEPMHILTYLRSSAYEQSPPLAESARPPARLCQKPTGRPPIRRELCRYCDLLAQSVFSSRQVVGKRGRGLKAQGVWLPAALRVGLARTHSPVGPLSRKRETSENTWRQSCYYQMSKTSDRHGPHRRQEWTKVESHHPP